MSSNPYTGATAGFDTERTVTGPFTGVTQNLGSPLAYAAVSVQLLIDGAVWHTFPAGEAIILDLRGNAAHAPTFVAPQGTQFQVIGTGGTGSFSISIVYAR
jgi:hypothetical protein